MPKLKLVSDGTMEGTYIIDSTGQKMDNPIESVFWEVCGEGLAKLYIILKDVPIVADTLDENVFNSHPDSDVPPPLIE